MEKGTRIKKIREYRSYTQDFMADALGISQNAYSKIESNQTKLTAERLEKVAEILAVPVDLILDNEKQIFNLDNTKIDNFYGYIENLFQENREAHNQTINTLQEQINVMVKQNELLMRTIEKLQLNK
ncbi:MAG TPA: helix-turn-helix transcriptional regulator [Cytophagales bacterium]|nr:helix-turn-helix transcriptional regulator [Cytophagales bacterium]